VKTALTRLLLAFVTALVVLTGCSNHSRSYRSNSLVELLYGNSPEQTLSRSQTIELPVPLNVGLAFVPGNDSSEFPTMTQLAAASERIKAQFAADPAVRRIQLIPSQRLQGLKGFDSLAELGRLYQVDVLALVSYDQVMQQDYNKASLLYLTLVGSYLIKGNEGSVQTFMETAVFDIRSRQLLFTASGHDVRGDTSTEVNAGKVFGNLQATGFSAATDQMSAQLQTALAGFKHDLKDDQRITVKSRVVGGYGQHNGGGGSLPESLIALAVLLIAGRSLMNWLDRIRNIREK